jgi:putative transposase
MRRDSLMNVSPSLYHRHRFPAKIISHCVWLYFRFSLSFRDVEEMMSIRGVSLTYETVREWCLKFKQSLATQSTLARRQWHLEEVFLKINGYRYYLWRVVDRWRCFEHLGPKQKRQESCQEVLSQVVEGIALYPARAHYRQVENRQVPARKGHQDLDGDD